MARTRKQARRLGLDRRYLDAPRFPVIIEYEQEFQKQYKKNMKDMMKSKKFWIAVAVVVIIFGYTMWTGQPAPEVAQ